MIEEQLKNLSKKVLFVKGVSKAPNESCIFMSEKDEELLKEDICVLRFHPSEGNEIQERKEMLSSVFLTMGDNIIEYSKDGCLVRPLRSHVLMKATIESIFPIRNAVTGTMNVQVKQTQTNKSVDLLKFQFKHNGVSRYYSALDKEGVDALIFDIYKPKIDTIISSYNHGRSGSKEVYQAF